MTSVLTAMAVLLVLLIILLAVPIDLAFNIDRTDKVNGHVYIRWLFGLVRFRINIPDETRLETPKPNQKTPSTSNTDQRRDKSFSPNIIAVFKQSAFRQRLYRFIKDLLYAVHSHDLHLHFRIGLGDPADTGRLWIFLGPISAMAANIRSAEVRIEPEFMDPVFEIRGNGEFRFMPLEFIALTIAFVLSPPALRAWRTLSQPGVY